MSSLCSLCSLCLCGKNGIYHRDTEDAEKSRSKINEFLSEDIRQNILTELPKYPTKRVVTLSALHHRG